MDPVIWGPAVWRSMHSLAATYPTKPTNTHKKEYKILMSLILKYLPCSHCRSSAKVFSMQIPIDMYLCDRYHLLMYTYILHWRVTEKLNRQYNLNRVTPDWSDIVRKEYPLALTGVADQDPSNDDDNNDDKEKYEIEGEIKYEVPKAGNKRKNKRRHKSKRRSRRHARMKSK